MRVANGDSPARTEAKRKASELVERLPDFIRVGPFDFAILRMDSIRAQEEHKFGFFSAPGGEIAIQAEFAHPTKAADTLVHEISHAIFWAYGIEDGDKEERIVSVTASAWCQVYRDNPWLLGWLSEALTGPTALVVRGLLYGPGDIKPGTILRTEIGR